MQRHRLSNPKAFLLALAGGLAMWGCGERAHTQQIVGLVGSAGSPVAPQPSANWYKPTRVVDGPRGVAPTESGRPKLLDFWAAWCGPCQRITPLADQLRREGHSVQVVDFDRDFALKAKYHVERIPCLILIDHAGRELCRIDGNGIAQSWPNPIENLRGWFVAANQIEAGYAGGVVAPAEQAGELSMSAVTSMAVRHGQLTDQTHSSGSLVANAQPQPRTRYQRTAAASTIDMRAIVQVGRDDLLHPGESSHGGGCYVGRLAIRTGNRGLALTAAHVVSEGGGQVWVGFGQGDRQPATVICQDANLDIAALAFNSPPADVQPIQICGDNERPQSGEQVEFCSWKGLQLSRHPAAVLGYTADWGTGRPTQLEIGYPARSGDSGGPILYRDKLAAIEWGGRASGPNTLAETAKGTESSTIRKFLAGCGCLPVLSSHVTSNQEQ